MIKMDRHEAVLLDRLKDYYHAKKDMEEALADIEEILLLYDFDIENIHQAYPSIDTIISADRETPIRRKRTPLRSL